MNSTNAVSKIKSLFVKKGIKARKIPFGPFRGLTLGIDLSHQTQVYLGLWERETYPFLKDAARSCEWAIDVGAGMGELCVYLVKQSQARRVIAFEPSPRALEFFYRNLELNNCRNDHRLSVMTCFVGVQSDSNSTTIDSLRMPAIEEGFIKIDVEGAELDVLRSATRVLCGGTVKLLIETHSKQLEDECVRFLQGFGYECIIIKNAWWKRVIREDRPIPHNRWLWATNERRANKDVHSAL